MKRMIAHSRPYVGEAEARAVRGVLLSRQLAQGVQVESLERELAARAGHRYGIAVSSGTAAIYCALKALEIGCGHEVVIPTYVCTALLNAVNMAGAAAVLADVDPFSGNLTAELVKKRLTRKCRAVIVPHLFGFPADIRGIERLGVPVIEDCAQCVGATIQGERTGGLSTLSVFSFYATKLIAAGEGGMVATSDPRIRDRVIELREYDKRESVAPAFNFKLSDVHAAIARVQLKKLDRMIRLRRALARAYREALASLSSAGLSPAAPPGIEPVYFRFVVTVEAGLDRVIAKLRRAGVECGRPVYKPLHRLLGRKGFPSADYLHDTSLSLPVHPGLSKKEIAYVADQVKKVLTARGGR